MTATITTTTATPKTTNNNSDNNSGNKNSDSNNSDNDNTNDSDKNSKRDNINNNNKKRAGYFRNRPFTSNNTTGETHEVVTVMLPKPSVPSAEKARDTSSLRKITFNFVRETAVT